METLARLGYGARGFVYLLVGLLAVLAAIGWGGGTGGSRSALAALLGQPFGAVLVGLLALGLLAFALWRVVQGIGDADRRGTDAKAVAVRAVRVGSGLVYLALAVSAIGMASGRPGGSRGVAEGQAARDGTAWLLAQPFGRWLVAAIGFAVVGAGLNYLRRGYTGAVGERLRVPAGFRDGAMALGRLGFGARGVVFCLIGAFLAVAAWHSDSSEVRGLGGALEALRAQPFGWILLAVVAAGLAAFGAFGLVQARYRRLDPPGPAEMADALIPGRGR